MITPTEAGLTQDEWDDLLVAVEDAIFEATLYAWNPSFSTHTAGTGTLDDFDAILHGGTIYRASGTGVQRLDTGLWPDVSGYSAPSGLVAGKPLALVSDTSLYVFAITDTGISRRSYNGSTWSSWTEIVTDNEVAFIAATDSDCLHYVTYDATARRYHFKVWDGVDDLDSDIYWGYALSSFSARRLNGVDVLAITSTVPGIMSAKVVGVETVKYVMEAGGTHIFTYKYGTWSDHIEIDHVDQWTDYRSRSHAKMSLIDDTLWLTAYSSEGTEDTPIAGYRLYNSKDGLHWSRGELFDSGMAGVSGYLILRLGTTLYTVSRDEVRSGHSTLWFGNPHSSQVLDVTRRVRGLRANRRDVQQVVFQLTNEDSWMAGTFLSSARTLAFILKTGYTINEDDLLVQAGIFEIDNLDPASTNPLRTLQLTGRDRFAWMVSKSQAENFVNWLPQGIGVEDYHDVTGTGYGGMSHTFPMKGTWKASDAALRIVTNNEEAIAGTTFLYDTWNGAIETHFILSQAANSEYAGVFFRAQDKDNLHYYIWNQSDGKLKLYQRAGGIDTLLWEQTRGFGSPGQGKLRAEFYYSRVRLYSFFGAVGAGVIWSLEEELLLDGQAAETVSTFPSPEAGYMGHIGKGFSDEDSWSPDPGPTPTPSPTPLPPPTDPLQRGSGRIALFCIDSTLRRTTNFTALTPIWDSVSLPSLIGWDTGDTLKSGVQMARAQDTALIATDEHIYLLNSLINPTTVTLKHTFGYAWAVGQSERYIQTERCHPTWAMCLTWDYPSSRMRVAYTIDGNVWAEGFVGSTGGGLERTQLWMSPITPGLARITTFNTVSGGDGPISVYETTNYGATWSDLVQVVAFDGRPAQRIEVPYTTPGTMFISLPVQNGGVYDLTLYRVVGAVVTDVTPTYLGDGYAAADLLALRTWDTDANYIVMVGSHDSADASKFGAVFRSTTGVAGLTAVIAPPTSLRNAFIAGDGQAVYLTGAGTIYYSDDFLATAPLDKSGSGIGAALIVFLMGW